MEEKLELGLRIYMAGAIKGDTTYGWAQDALVDSIRRLATADDPIQIWSEKVGDSATLPISKAPQQVFQRDKDWLEKSDALIAEISGESFGTGWEISYAQFCRKIPVLCLINRDVDVPPMLAGIVDDDFHLARYSSRSEMQSSVTAFIEEMRSKRQGDAARELISTRERGDAAGVLTRSPIWLEGSRGRNKHRLELFAYLDSGKQPAADRVSDLFLALNTRGEIRKTQDYQTPEELFREVNKKIFRSRRGIMLLDVSYPSTSQGWLAGRAQWKGIRCVTYYPEGEDISWIIVGQPQMPFFFDQKYGHRDFEIVAFDASRRTKRPPIIHVPYQSESELIHRIDLLLEEFSKNYRSIRMQETLEEFLKDAGRVRQGEWTRGQEIRFLAETVVRSYIWMNFTKEGIAGKGRYFIGGARTELLRLLRYHHTVSSPSRLHERIGHAVGFTVEALAKEVRALKDAGILLKRDVSHYPPRENRTASASQQITLEGSEVRYEKPSRKRKMSFVSDEIILTKYGHDLCDYLYRSGHPARTLINVIRNVLPQFSEVFQALPISEDKIENFEGYFVNEDWFPRRVRQSLLANILDFCFPSMDRLPSSWIER